MVRSLLLALALVLGFAASAQAAPASLEVTQSLVVNGTEVATQTLPAGGTTTLLLKYKCASVSVACKNAKASLPIPSGIATGAAAPSGDVASIDSAGSQRVINFKASLPAGTTGAMTIDLAVPAWTTPDNAAFNWRATMAADNADAVQSGPITITGRAASTTSAIGSQTAGRGVGDVTTYTVGGCAAGTSDPATGPLGIVSGSKLVVALPAGATVLERGDAAYNATDRTLTFTLGAVNGGCPGGGFRLEYPASDPSNVPGATKTLDVTWLGRKVGATGTGTLGTTAITHTLISAAPASTLNKTLGAPRAVSGVPAAAVKDEVTYTLAANNSGSRTWGALTITDSIPDILDVTALRVANPGQDPATLWVTTAKGQDGVAGNADDTAPFRVATVPGRESATVRVGTDLSLGAGDYVTRAELRAGDVYPGLGGAPLAITAKVLATSRTNVASAAGTTFSNSATFVVDGVSAVRTADGVVDQPSPGVTVRHTGGNVPTGTRETSFDLTGWVFGDDLAAPVFVVELPARTALKTWTSTVPGGRLTTQANFDGSGSTLLRWDFPAGTKVANATTLGLHYEITLDRSVWTARTVRGWISQQAPNGTPCGDNWFDGSQDTRDKDGDGNTTEVLCPWFAGLSFPTSSSARLTQSVKGSWDADFADGPAVGFSSPGFNDVYRLHIDSEATMNLDQAVAIDVLPRPGDTAVVSGTQRNPSTGTFPVFLRGRPVVPALGSPVVTYYSTAADPCRPELGFSPAGCNPAGWVNWDVTPPAQLRDVTAVKFDFGANTLAPGDRWTVELPVTTPTSGATEPDFALVNPDPTSPETDEVAYNSTGFVIRRTDLGVQLLPSEALAVGLDMPSAYGPPGARPTAAVKTTSGTGVTPQTTTLSIPAHGSVALMDGLTPVNTLTVPGVGTYVLTPATGVVTFTPAYGFAGEAPAVAYRRRDVWGQSAVSSYVATVLPPAAPTPAPKTTNAVGGSAQNAPVTVPAGGSLVLLDRGARVSSITRPGVGTFSVAGGELVFTPVPGYAGTPAPVAYEVTDAYGQTGEATYAPSVVAPAPADVPSGSTTAGAGVVQTYTVAVPAGGSVALLGADGPGTSVTVAGEGVYTLDGGVITFTPSAGFSGRASGVRFRVTDQYGQVREASYTPVVTVAVVTPPPPVVVTECVSRRAITINFIVPKGVKVRDLKVTLDGKAYKTLKAGDRKVLFDMRGRAKARLVVGIVARTRSGAVLQAQRVYKTCTPRENGAPLETLRLRAGKR